MSGFSYFQDCAGVILYAAENATQVALDAIQILGKCYLYNYLAYSSCTKLGKDLFHLIPVITVFSGLTCKPGEGSTLLCTVYFDPFASFVCPFKHTHVV